MTGIWRLKQQADKDKMLHKKTSQCTWSMPRPENADAIELEQSEYI